MTMNPDHPRKGPVSIRALRLAALFLAVAIVFLEIPFALAPHSETAWRAAFEIAAFSRRLVNLPGIIRHRDPRCSLAEAWNESVVSQQILIGRHIRPNSRLVKVEDGFSRLETPAGNYWIPARDVSEFLDELVEQETDIYGRGGRGVKPGDTVLDCGANVGVYTRHALNRGAKLVVAIEPAPESLECLRRNFSEEVGEGRVIIYPKGVWNKDDELELTVSSSLASTASSVALGKGGSKVKVPLTTIDKIVQELGLNRVDVVKMDIEGAERQALQGAKHTVARFRPWMAITLEHRPSDPEEIPLLVKQLWPDYKVECGRCEVANGRLRPDILFAY